MPPKKATGRGRPKVVEEKLQNGESAVKATRGRGKKVDSKAAGETEITIKGGKKAEQLKQVEDYKLRKVTVTLHQMKYIDGSSLNVADDSNKVKKNAKDTKSETKGKRARSDSEDGDTKPAKVRKESGKSKGQSKSDKMPDVTLRDFGNESSSPSGKSWNLKLSSWNINGIRAWLEKDGLEYLKHENPDVLCVQETKCSDDKLPEETKVTGYHTYWFAGDKDGYSGVGLLSKIKPIAVKYGIGMEEHDKEGRVITAEYEKFFLINAYVPNAGRKLVRLDYRMQWDKDFCLYLKSLEERKPIVLCGDLNVAHTEIDLANPKTNKRNAGFTQEERDGFSALLSEGLVDSFRHLYPDLKGAYTFWTYMMNARAKNVGWRLDYFIMSKKLVENLCDNVIRKDVMGSDHCPITLFLSV